MIERLDTQVEVISIHQVSEIFKVVRLYGKRSGAAIVGFDNLSSDVHPDALMVRPARKFPPIEATTVVLRARYGSRHDFGPLPLLMAVL